MASSDDDEDLRRAIALSLGEDSASSAEVIDVVDSETEDEDEDLRRAIAMSLQDSERDNNNATSSESQHNASTSHAPEYDTKKPDDKVPAHLPPDQPSFHPTADKPVTGILGLDRKAMEQERLARLRKRKRDPSPEQPPKTETEAPASKKVASEGSSQPGSQRVQNGIQYPKGTIKRTWANKHPRTNDVKIEEVFQSPNIAVLSALQFDDRWVFSKLSPNKTKQIWIMSAKEKELQDKLLQEATEARIPNFKPHFPPLEGRSGHMHSKLMLLFHDGYLRVVVPTANMFNVDWGETNQDAQGRSWQAAVLENSVFMIDLPRRSDGKVGSKKELSKFGLRLLEFLEAQQLGKNVTEGVLKFDYSNTHHIAFVHSIPGEQTSRFADRTGLSGLETAVRELGLGKVKTIELDYAASSLGSLKEWFLKRLYMAACGSQSSPVPQDSLEHIRIYFPTHDTVANSTGGPACGGVINLNRQFFENQAFPKQCMRDYISTRPGVLSHNKLLLARGRKTDGTPFAWAYIGSANLSEAAWGRQNELKSGRPGKLSINNWEAGVVIPVPEEAFKELKVEDGEVPPMTVFGKILEIPFQYPGEPYGSRKPWYFMEYLG